MNATEPAGTVVNIRYESKVLKDNPLGDPHIRDLFVYLPPGYDETDAAYPAVYCLTGFTGRGKMLLNDNAFTPNLAERMDKLIAAGTVRPMIVVMPNCFTHYGGSQYINSTATGRYEDYLIEEIVPFVDENFRTIKGDPNKFMHDFWATEKQNKDDHAALNTIGMAACYSPNGTDFDLPFDLETGELREEVWKRWLEHDPVRLADKYAGNLRSLKLLYIDAGTRDEFNLDIGAKILSAKLTELDVPHIHEEFDDAHFNISYRYDRSLELISQNAGR
jgi:S-formylglutathione hydrolase FrmB